MARDVFRMTLSNMNLIDAASGPDIPDVLATLEDIQVSAYTRGTTNAVTIFQRPTGATQGPTPESGASGGPNPFITGQSGNVEFWVDSPAEVDVVIHDTHAPSRIVDRAFGWNAVAVGAGSLPTSVLKTDGSLALGSLGPDVVRQLSPIGTVIDWWRPQASVTVPSGWEICDGRQIAAGSHDFVGVAGAINLPDLRNTFILGADSSKAQGTGANQGNAVTDAPGIAGTGGSNAGKNLAHGHGVPGVDHSHHNSTPDHYHTLDAGTAYTGGHSHGVGMGAANRAYGAAFGGGEPFSFANHAHSAWTDAPGNLGIGGSTAGSIHSLASWTGGANVSLNSATNSTTWTADPGSDMRPRFVGLLKLMKVRRS